MENTNDIPKPETPPRSPPSGGSEIMGRKYRKQLATEICILQDRVKWLEECTRDAEDVIPWIAVESVLQSANHLAYLAGMVNGTKMARYEEKSPNNDMSGPSDGSAPRTGSGTTPKTK